MIRASTLTKSQRHRACAFKLCFRAGAVAAIIFGQISLMPIASRAAGAKTYPLSAYHYELMMSADPVCEPLTEKYNSLLKEQFRQHPNWQTTGWSPRTVWPTFEVSQTTAFAAIGLREPDYELSKYNDGTRLYSFAIYNDGITRTLALQDIQEEHGVLHTSATVVKLGSTYKEVTSKGAPDVGLGPDPAIVERDAGWKALVMSQSNPYPYEKSYLLTAWPRYAEIFQLYTALGRPRFWPGTTTGFVLPSIDTVANTIRPFIYKGATYFILNDSSPLPPRYNDWNLILVYQLTASRHIEECYLALTPNLTVDSLRESGHVR